MCGICGQFNFADQSPVRRSTLKAMASSIVHRGPDDEGYYVEGPLGFGFRRLSILDLAGGHQPMSDPEESVWVVFNGEIYNFRELRNELEQRGHVFRTTCDTEAIVHGYKEWGEDVFNHLNGMFGVAIWDTRKRRLLVARDPFGIKPIYYRIDRGRLYFGSEMRAVLAATDQDPEIDPASLYLFLRYRYTPSPNTIFQNVQKLAPGTLLSFSNGTYKLRRWYRYQPKRFTPPKSPREASEELAHLYRKSIERHLLSDVPVGLLLSGGMDSGLLLALMNLYGKSWNTYTVGYGSGFADDELKDAEETAALFSARHSSVRLNVDTFEESLPGIIASLEEPIASSSVVPMYFVCQRARQDVKVALMGQGPDELFGGYRRHLGVRYGALWAGLPGFVRRPAASAIGALPRNETLKRALYSLDVPDRLRRYQNVLSLMPGPTLDGLFRDGLLGPETGDKILESWHEIAALSRDTDELGGFQFLELRSTLPDELLMYADKLSMAHSLEVRVPYLDKEIVEYVERLPASFKVRHGSRKWLHRQVCQGLLPKAILRRKKRGFAVNVVDSWFRGAVARNMRATLLDPESLIYQFMRPTAVEQLLAEHQSGEQDNHKVLFSIIVLEQWLRSYTGSLSHRACHI